MDTGIAIAPLTLETRFSAFDRPVLMSGVQALVRVLLEQSRLDRAAGLKTGGLVSGYRGSPLGGVDQEMWRREALLTEAGIRFQPGLNEDLAATMLWGTQQIDLFPGKRVDGVFGMWYGKGPGVDRSGDAFRCANTIGTARHGGVLAVSGDDHVAHSSVFPHTTEGIFESVNIPVLQPADVADIVDLGLAGIALSRFCGLWVALKTIAETAEQHGLATIPSHRSFLTPDFVLPPQGLNVDPTLPWPGGRQLLERRVLEERLPAARAWARANRLDRVMSGAHDAEIGIVTVGKAHHDLMHAMRRVSLDRHPALAVYKVAMTWPLETEGIREFAAGKRALIVVEEKRSFVERQIRDTLYNALADRRPPVLGKQDLDGNPLLPAVLELSPELIIPALARILPGYGIAVPTTDLAPSLAEPGIIARSPMFCAGCPHNTSTKLPDGSYAMAGIGCHTMAVMTSDATRSFSQMGGEGVPWVGLETFTDVPHLFANMGDGTYQHSGLLAIRQAIAAKTNITYKLLFNDAVAMTGGQPAEGAPTVIRIAAQLAAEGVAKLAVVADDPARLPDVADLPPGTLRHGRDELDAVQRTMREVPGVSAIIYDQVCATEKRRRRKRGKMAQAETRVIINPDVCENCGDCTAQSNCIAIEPIETDHGRKRRISPTSCNTDLSCLKGFCPSFVTSSAAAPPPVMDHAAHWQARETDLAAALLDPAPATAPIWRGLFAGIGGGGIVTCGQIVAMAAHLEDRPVSTLDFTGLAQKNGAVVSHVQIGSQGAALDVVRIPRREADLLLAADLAVAASVDVLGLCRKRAAVIGNLDLQAGAGFLRERDFTIDSGFHRHAIERATDKAGSAYLRGSAISERLFGTAQAVNTLMLGIAWQDGAIPLAETSLLRAIELNGTAVALNNRAFLWGRILATRPALADEILQDTKQLPEDMPSVIARRQAELVTYDGPRLARRYTRLVDATAKRETELVGTPGTLTRAVVEGFYRALATKDEYEVARLHAAADYGDAPTFHLAPPLLTGLDKATGRRRKIAIPGRIALPIFRVLRHGKVLRGIVFDPFGWQAERRQERDYIRQYEADLRAILPALRPDTLEVGAELARLPLDIRGFGPVKQAGFAAAAPRRIALLDQLRTVPVAITQAAE